MCNENILKILSLGGNISIIRIGLRPKALKLVDYCETRDNVFQLKQILRFSENCFSTLGLTVVSNCYLNSQVLLDICILGDWWKITRNHKETIHNYIWKCVLFFSVHFDLFCLGMKSRPGLTSNIWKWVDEFIPQRM